LQPADTIINPPDAPRARDGGALDRTPLPYALVPGDEISIKIVQDPDLNGNYRLDTDGSIQFPYIGPMRLDGLTTMDVRRKVKAGLMEVYTDPFVTVNIVSQEQQYVRVVGEVGRPGLIPWNRRMTIVDAIADAGDLTASGARTSIVLIRRTAEDEIAAGMFNYREAMHNPTSELWASNIPLERGDTIFVPRSDKAQWESAFKFIQTMFGTATDIQRAIILYPDTKSVLETGDRSGRTTVIVR
jgi:polysaccharide export outer membrane protein